MRDTELENRLNEQTHLLGFNDGVYDFTTQTFRKGRPDDFVMKTVGYDFPRKVDPTALESVQKVLSDPFSDTSMADYITSTLASCLDGSRRFQEFYIWTGRGSNGKSTIQELVMQTMGSYAHPLDMAFWTSPKGQTGGAMPEIADKKGVRIVFSNEPECKSKIQVSKIKEVTGGENITARRLYCDPVTYKPQFGIFICCNDLPELTKHDGGIERRTRVVPFVHQFMQHPLPGQKASDPAMLENCKRNIEWRKALMYILLQKHAQIATLRVLDLPEQVREASRGYMEDNNPVGLWLKEHFIVTNSRDDHFTFTQMFERYRIDTKDMEMTQKDFNKAMNSNGIEKDRFGKDRKHSFYGIHLIELEGGFN